MDSTLDIQRKERTFLSPQGDIKSLSSYLDTFFLGLQGDSKSLSSFVSTLSGFANAIRSHHHTMRAESLVTIQGFVSVINTVALNTLELERESEKLGDETLADIQRVLDRKMGNLTLNDEQNIKSSEAGMIAQFPAYIKSSYEWLLSNLHNPYPSKEVKKTIARQSKCSVRDIDSWFIDARKRIGWNTLRKQQFSNKQEKIIATATRFFKPIPRTFTDDLSTSLEVDADPDDAFHARFTAMENAARSLYSGKFIDVSSSYRHHDGVEVSPTSPITPTKDDKKRKRTLSLQIPYADRSQLHHLPESAHDPVQSYPTPVHSPEHFADSILPSNPHIVSYQRHVRSRKRRRTSVEPLEEGFGDNLIQLRKRFKPDNSESANGTIVAAPARLPSPAPTTDSLEDTPEDTPQPMETITRSVDSVLVPSVKRKRRLSGGDSQRPAKRPHHALAVPRLQAVSDPFPITKAFMDDSFDDWFNGNFSVEHQLNDAIPSPAGLEVQNLPSAVPLDVHCHSYNVSPYQSNITLPETPFLARSNVSREGLTSIPDGGPETSTHASLPILNSLPDVSAAEVISSGEFSLALDFDFPSAVEETVPQDISFNLLDSIINFDPLVQALPVDFNWMQFPLGDSVDLVEPSTSYIEETSDFDSTTHKGSIIPEDQDAKRLRVQFLKEELKLLESEIGA